MDDSIQSEQEQKEPPRRMPTTYYHTTRHGLVHKGRLRDCRLCKKTVSRSRKASGQEAGYKGGVISGDRRAKKPNFCKVCGKKIQLRTVSGMCRPCLNESKRQNSKAKAKTKQKKEPRKKCTSCDHPLGKDNKTGLCRKCYQAFAKEAELQRKKQKTAASRKSTSKENASRCEIETIDRGSAGAPP